MHWRYCSLALNHPHEVHTYAILRYVNWWHTEYSYRMVISLYYDIEIGSKCSRRSICIAWLCHRHWIRWWIFISGCTCNWSIFCLAQQQLVCSQGAVHRKVIEGRWLMQIQAGMEGGVQWINMMMSSNGDIFRVTGPLCGEFTGHRWIPRTKASDTELWCFLWTNDWINNQDVGDLRRYHAHYDVTVMESIGRGWSICNSIADQLELCLVCLTEKVLSRDGWWEYRLGCGKGIWCMKILGWFNTEM